MPTCEQIQTALERHERNAGLVRDESILKEALADHWYGRATHTAEDCLVVVLLVADWGSLDRFSFRDRVLYARWLSAHLQVFERLRDLTLDTWLADPEAMGYSMRNLTLECLMPNGTTNRQLSFVSKLIHWCFNPVFPIWDRNARKALDFTPQDYGWASYQDWAESFREEMMEHKECCLLPRQGSDRTIVRTLDRALYMIGGARLTSDVR